MKMHLNYSELKINQWENESRNQIFDFKPLFILNIYIYLNLYIYCAHFFRRVRKEISVGEGSFCHGVMKISA